MKSWVQVRVTDMRGIDLNIYRFNYDLTMAVLLMHPNGTIYSTYAGRDFTDASSHQSSTSLARVLNETLKRHRADMPAPKRRRPLFVEQFNSWKNKNQKGECFHCHNVSDARQRERREMKRWTERDQYDWPDPTQAGLQFEREGQVVVSDAKPWTGLRKGDRIVSIGAVRPISFGDIKKALNQAPWGRNRLKLEWLRGSKKMTGAIALKDGWKKPTPKVYAWRPAKWPMSPKPGFGGPLLSTEEKTEAGLAKDRWAFRVNYIVTWGPNADTGRNAAKAGIRKNMIVHAVAGKDDFESMEHFHAWFRMTQMPGKPIRLKVIHKGRTRTLTLTPLP